MVFSFETEQIDNLLHTNVWSSEKLTKRSTVLLLRLVSFSAEQTLPKGFKMPIGIIIELILKNKDVQKSSIIIVALLIRFF